MRAVLAHRAAAHQVCMGLTSSVSKMCDACCAGTSCIIALGVHVLNFVSKQDVLRVLRWYIVQQRIQCCAPDA